MKKLLFFLMAIIFAITGKAQTPLNEGFEATTFPPEDWTAITTSGTNQWSRNTSSPTIGTASAKCAYRSGGHISYLITPKLVVSANDTLKFFAAKSSSGTTNFRVCVSTTYQQNGLSSFDTVNPLMSMLGGNMLTTLTQYNVDLSQFAGQEVYIAFQITDYYGCHIFLDNVTGPNLFVPTCPKPRTLITSNPTTIGVDLGWTDPTGTIYNIQYMLNSETDWANATTVSGVTNPYTFNTLNPSTYYKARVQRECISEQSEWSTPITFTTACETITQFPWIEGFENDFNSIAIAPGNKPAPFCWFIIDSLNTSSYFWKTSTSAYSGSNSIYMNGYSTASSSTTASYQNNEWLISPIISLTGNERLNFWSKKSSSSYYPDLLVYAMDVSAGDLDATASNSNFVYLGEVDTNLLSTTYAPYEFNLSTLVGDYRLAFVRKKTASGSVYIDDVKVSAIPTCFPPTEIAMSNITSDQAELNFTPAEITGPSWNVMLINLSTNATVTEPIYSLPHTFYNLTPNTNYSVSIITDCGDGTFSDPTLPLTFRTQCVPATVPFVENFTTSVIDEPTCWSRMKGLLADTSVLIPYSGGWIHSTTLDNAMRVNIYGTSVNYWLVTPSIDLGDGSLQYQVEFDVVLTAYTGAPANPPTYDSDDKFAVVVSTDNGLTWLKTNATIWAEGDADTIRNFSNFSLSPTHVVVKLIDSLQIPYSGIIKIGFYGESTVSVSDNYLYIDNVAINEIPMCPAVFNTTASVDNFSTIRVNFATDNAEPGTGWDIAYAETDPTSFDPNAATIVSVNDATELPYIITGLNAGSTYSLSVRQNCGGEWSPAVSSKIPNIVSTVTIPYTQNFEDLNNIAEWTLSNPDTNKWYIGGNVISPDGIGNTMYISNDGTINNYAHKLSHSYASTIVDFGNIGAAEYNLSFDWKSGGESTWDFFKVYLLPIDAEIPATGFPSTPDISGILNLNNEWQRANIILPTSVYENTVKKLLFVWKNDASGGNGVSAAIDNIQILPMTCATPSNLVVSSVDQTNATISWTENGTSTSWLIEYSFNGINWTSELASTNTDFVLSNLNPSSTYQVRVYSLCSSIDTSSFVSNVFQTECGVISQFPWVEGFDEAFIGTTASNSLTAAPRCWLNYNGGYTSTTYVWKRGTTASNIYSGSGYAYMDGYGSTTSATYTNNDWLITPVLQLTGNERLNFWVKKEGATYTPDLAIYVLDMNNGDVNATDSISNFTLLANIPNNTISTTYQQQEVDLSSLNGQYRLAFVRLQPSQYDLYIDEVKVSSLPNCRRVSDVALSNVSHEEATITWTPGQTTDAAWNIYLTQGSSTITIPVTQIPTTITNLLPNTDYSFVVKTDCGTEESDPTIPISFTTSCTPISVPFLEEFNTSPLTNDCWKQHNGLLADTVVFTSNTSSWAYNTTNPAASPITSMRLNIWGTSMKSWLITPTIDLGNTSNLYQLEFDVTNTDDLQMLIPGVLTGVDDKFAVVISTDNGLTWTSANAHIWSNETGATRVYNDLMSTTPIHIIIPLQDENLTPYQGLIKIGFYGESTVSNADNYLNIDNVAINEWTDCQRPTGLAVNGVSFDQATISFTEQGTASSWEYSLGIVIDGIDNDPDAGTIISIFDNPHTIQGLTPSTDYFVAVRSDCMSPWSDIVTFRTAPLPVTSFPYLATFDEYDPESSNWTSISNSVNKWVVGDATSSSLGNSTDLYSAYISFNDGDSNSATTATTRAYFYRDFDFGTTPTTYDLSFDWKCLGTYTSSTNTVSSGIMVIPCETTDSINLGGLPLNQNQRVLMVHSQTDWQNASTQLDNMSGLKRIIFFTWGYSAANRYNPAAIDNISLTETTCARPTDVTISDINTTSALISWNGSAGSYIVTYRAAGDATDTYVNVSGNSTTLSNLSSGTNYYVWVKSVCGSENSINSPSESFMTPCVPIASLPWTDGFESVSTAGEFPACFVSQGVSGKLTTGVSTQSYERSARTGSNYATFQYACWNRLYTPEFDLVAGTNYTFSFWYKANSGTGWDLSAGLYSIKGDTNSFVSAIGSQITTGITTSYQQFTGTFSVATSGNYSIGIFCKATYAPWYLTIDDLSLDGDLACLPPTNITVTPSNISATVTWTAGGGEASWEVRLGETGTPETVSSTNHSLSGLTPNTTYTVYVRGNCGESYSSWIPTQFTTTTDPTPPIVTTAVPTTLITQTTAVFNGEYVETSSPILTKGFEYKEASSNDWTEQEVIDGTTPFTFTATGLTSSTDYQAKAYVNTATDGRVYGNTINFTTLVTVPPTVTTDSVRVITETSATFYGKIIENTEAIEARGFEYKLITEDWDDAINISATGITEIFATATTLTNGMTYEVRAYGRTLSGKAYGLPLTFAPGSLNGVIGQDISIMMYPNPATSQTNLVISGISGEAKIILSDVQGRVLNTINAKPVSGTIEQTIDLNNLAKGVYYIRIQNSDVNRTQKLIVK